jgi:hypothetical protein
MVFALLLIRFQPVCHFVVHPGTRAFAPGRHLHCLGIAPPVVLQPGDRQLDRAAAKPAGPHIRARLRRLRLRLILPASIHPVNAAQAVHYLFSFLFEIAPGNYFAFFSISRSMPANPKIQKKD